MLLGVLNCGDNLVQEDDVIGILASDNIADLKPLGDRLLVEVNFIAHTHKAECVLFCIRAHMGGADVLLSVLPRLRKVRRRQTQAFC